MKFRVLVGSVVAHDVVNCIRCQHIATCPICKGQGNQDGDEIEKHLKFVLRKFGDHAERTFSAIPRVSDQPQIVSSLSAWEPSPVFETDANLEMLLNQRDVKMGNCKKVERMPDDAAVGYPPSLPPSNSPSSSQPPAGAPVNRGTSSDPFDSMTVEELRKQAIAEEIDLGKAKSKDEIIKILRSHTQTVGV